MKKWKKFILCVLVFATLIIWMRWCQGVTAAPPIKVNEAHVTTQVAPAADSTNEALNMFRKAYDGLKPLLIKGEAVDSDGRPLEGVKIQISWSTAGFLIGLPMDHNKTSWVISDKKGAWTFKLDKPGQVSIRTAQKEGYAFDRLRSTKSDMAGLAERQNLTEFPATVVMRKRLEEVLLLACPDLDGRGELCMWLEQGQSKTVTVDVLAERGKKDPEYADLQISSIFDQTNQCWGLTFMVPDGFGGILNINELLYEAPIDGYKKDVVFIVAIKERTEADSNYLYLRSRSQKLYTRVMYRYDSWNDNRTGPTFRLYLATVTNPYGERSFEDATGLRKYTFARDELLEEAKKAIQSGGLPKKPENLAKHLEERDKILEEAWRHPKR